MFKTDMGSLAFEKIYDWLELDNQLMSTGMVSSSDDPSPVRKVKSQRIENVMTLRENIEDEIVGWLQATKIQERGINDILYIDKQLDNILTDRGILQQVYNPQKEKKAK